MLVYVAGKGNPYDFSSSSDCIPMYKRRDDVHEGLDEVPRGCGSVLPIHVPGMDGGLHCFALISVQVFRNASAGGSEFHIGMPSFSLNNAHFVMNPGIKSSLVHLYRHSD